MVFSRFMQKPVLDCNGLHVQSGQREAPGEDPRQDPLLFPPQVGQELILLGSVDLPLDLAEAPLLVLLHL
jgi:hypothetical protein